MKIRFAGHELILHQSGLLLWPAARRALAADLHLEKGSHYAQRYYFLPPYDSHYTLQKLLGLCRTLDIGQLVVMGDCFHDPDGYQRLKDDDRSLFTELLDFDPVWIRGNHDCDFVPPGFAPYDDFEIGGLVLRHQAVPGAASEISGHFHPKTEIRHKSAALTRRCFIEDGRKLILPAFGAYTGGLSIEDPAIALLMTAPCRVYALGESRVYALQNNDIC